MGRLKSKIALITGAASGIGRATAERFAEEGATVVLTDIADGQLAETLSALRSMGGGEHCAIQMDVTLPEAWVRAIKQVDSDFGQLHILVNNAGSGRFHSIEATDLEEWRSMLALNLDAVFLGTKYSLPLLTRSGTGSIVNISSISGLISGPSTSAYSAAKGGVRLFTKATALECAAAGNGVRVNSVHPGPVETPANAAVLRDPSAARRLKDLIPLKRIGKPTEIASVIAFLASDEASFMTGSEVVVDGGFTAR